MEQKIIPILMYHSIRVPQKHEVMRSLYVTPKSFWWQMRLLDLLGYRGCTVSEACNSLTNGSREKLVALTFDDGYENFISEAFPILQKYRFKATVYAVTALIGKTNEWDKKNKIHESKLMTANQLKIVQAAGMEIGCHSMTHSSLTDDSTNYLSEVNEAKAMLEELIDNKCHSFCYPYGHFSDRLREHVSNAGFLSATTMIRGRASVGDLSLSLPRIPITWHTLPHLFLAKILTTYEDKRRYR